MAITLIVTASVAPGSPGGTTVAVDTTGATLLVWSVGWLNSATLTTPTDNKGNTWLPLTKRGPGQFAAHRFWYATNPIVGAGHTFTAGGTGTYAAQIVHAFAGTDLGAPFDVESGNTVGAGSASVASGSVTPSMNGCVIVAGYSCMTNPGNTAEALAPTMTMAAIGTAAAGRTVTGHLIQTTAAAINPTWSWTGTAGVAVGTAVFKPAAPTAAAAVRVTQSPVEVLSLAPPPIRVTQAGVEVLSLAPVQARVTQYVVEALSDAYRPKDYTWQIKDLTDAERWMTGLLVFPVGDVVTAPPPAPPDAPTASPSQVVIPMHVTTRVVLPSGVDAWGADCLCDE